MADERAAEVRPRAGDRSRPTHRDLGARHRAGDHDVLGVDRDQVPVTQLVPGPERGGLVAVAVVLLEGAGRRVDPGDAHGRAGAIGRARAEDVHTVGIARHQLLGAVRALDVGVGAGGAVTQAGRATLDAEQVVRAGGHADDGVTAGVGAVGEQEGDAVGRAHHRGVG